VKEDQNDTWPHMIGTVFFVPFYTLFLVVAEIVIRITKSESIVKPVTSLVLTIALALGCIAIGQWLGGILFLYLICLVMIGSGRMEHFHLHVDAQGEG